MFDLTYSPLNSAKLSQKSKGILCYINNGAKITVKSLLLGKSDTTYSLTPNKSVPSISAKKPAKPSCNAI